MSAVPDVEDKILCHLRAAIVALHGKLGEAGEDVQTGYDAAVGLDCDDLLLDFRHEFPVDSGLDGIDPLFGAENLAFIFLELLRDVALGIDEGLLAYPLLRHKVTESVADFDVIAEDIVVADLKGSDSGSFGLAALKGKEVVLPAGRDVPQFVELRVDSSRDHFSLADGGCRLRSHRRGDGLKEFRTVLHAGNQIVQGSDAPSGAEG